MYLPNRRKPWLPWLVLLAVLFVLAQLFHLLNDVLMPFVTAAVLAYILNPLVGRLEKHGISRSRASLWVMAFTFMLLVALLLVIVPMLLKQLQNIISRIPLLVDYVQNTILPWVNARFGEHIALDNATITAWLRDNTQNIQHTLQRAMPVLMQQGTSLAGWLGNIVLLPLLLYYFLLDWTRWENGVRTMIPRRYLAVYNRIAGNMDTVLGEFLRGQLTVMVIMGLLYGFGLKLTGLESGFAIGMVAGILVFVPYLGAFTGLLLATLAALLQFASWQGLLSVWAVFAVGQFLESFFITPKIVGDRIGLSPFWVIFSLMAFGSLFGFVGMLVALPLAAVCLVLLREGKQLYLHSEFYRRKF
ncbi:AI-2E family transporter [Conchiformibius kuhniae]|uniref:AI-2E family transporter n=1 Tax=Conchiformibius kuhniae TaxID=211502 RepID=A0A8T9MTZ4_9NEIS|nr:AI-2E family transporter [Conchiformibius kuhniae]UOP04295.1 AI-2E family transporter [Conchiformibius kuhniae]